METPVSIAQEMSLFSKSPAIQLAQTAMRKQLVDAWGIPSGARILEIGCGQGDFTAVLADAVGTDGYIMAIDLAGPDYGYPVSIGKSTDHLKSGRYGKIIDFRLRYDLFADEEHLHNGPFDFVVLAHSSWFLDSIARLRSILESAHVSATRLCISEWNLSPESPRQFAHMLAVLLRGQIEAFRTATNANIRSPYSLSMLEGLLAATGWQVKGCCKIDCSELTDGLCEINMCLSCDLRSDAGMGIPERILSLLEGESNVLRTVAAQFGKESLSSFALQAVSNQKPNADDPNVADAADSADL